MSIVDTFRDMPDFKPAEKPPLSIDLTAIRRDINALLRVVKLGAASAEFLQDGLDRILPGTGAET